MRTPQTRPSARLSGRLPRGRLSWAALVTTLLLTLSGCAGLPAVTHSTQAAQLDPCTSALLQTRATEPAASGGLGRRLRVLASLQAGRQWLTVAARCPSRWSQGVVQAAAAYQEAIQLSAKDAVTDDLDQLVTTTAPAGSLPNDTLKRLGTASLRALAQAQDRAAFGFEVLAARATAGQTDSQRLRALSLAHRESANVLAQAALACPADRPTGSVGGCSPKDPRSKLYSVDSLLADQAEATDPSTGLQAPRPAIIQLNCALEELAALTGLSPNRSGQPPAGPIPVSSLGQADSTALAGFLTQEIINAYNLGYPASPLPLRAD